MVEESSLTSDSVTNRVLNTVGISALGMTRSQRTATRMGAQVSHVDLSLSCTDVRDPTGAQFGTAVRACLWHESDIKHMILDFEL